MEQWHTAQPSTSMVKKSVNIYDMFKTNINDPIFSDIHNKPEYKDELVKFRRKIYQLVGVMQRERYQPATIYDTLRDEYKFRYKKNPPDMDRAEDLYIKLINYQELEYLTYNILGYNPSKQDKKIVNNIFKSSITKPDLGPDCYGTPSDQWYNLYVNDDYSIGRGWIAPLDAKRYGPYFMVGRDPTRNFGLVHKKNGNPQYWMCCGLPENNKGCWFGKNPGQYKSYNFAPGLDDKIVDLATSNNFNALTKLWNNEIEVATKWIDVEWYDKLDKKIENLKITINSEFVGQYIASIPRDPIHKNLPELSISNMVQKLRKIYHLQNKYNQVFCLEDDLPIGDDDVWRTYIDNTLFKKREIMLEWNTNVSIGDVSIRRLFFKELWESKNVENLTKELKDQKVDESHLNNFLKMLQLLLNLDKEIETNWPKLNEWIGDIYNKPRNIWLSDIVIKKLVELDKQVKTWNAFKIKVSKWIIEIINTYRKNDNPENNYDSIFGEITIETPSSITLDDVLDNLKKSYKIEKGLLNVKKDLSVDDMITQKMITNDDIELYNDAKATIDTLDPNILSDSNISSQFDLIQARIKSIDDELKKYSIKFQKHKIITGELGSKGTLAQIEELKKYDISTLPNLKIDGINELRKDIEKYKVKLEDQRKAKEAEAEKQRKVKEVEAEEQRKAKKAEAEEQRKAKKAEDEKQRKIKKDEEQRKIEEVEKANEQRKLEEQKNLEKFKQQPEVIDTGNDGKRTWVRYDITNKFTPKLPTTNTLFTEGNFVNYSNSCHFDSLLTGLFKNPGSWFENKIIRKAKELKIWNNNNKYGIEDAIKFHTNLLEDISQLQSVDTPKKCKALVDLTKFVKFPLKHTGDESDPSNMYKNLKDFYNVPDDTMPNTIDILPTNFEIPQKLDNGYNDNAEIITFQYTGQPVSSEHVKLVGVVFDIDNNNTDNIHMATQSNASSVLIIYNENVDQFMDKSDLSSGGGNGGIRKFRSDSNHKNKAGDKMLKPGSEIYHQTALVYGIPTGNTYNFTFDSDMELLIDNSIKTIMDAIQSNGINTVIWNIDTSGNLGLGIFKKNLESQKAAEYISTQLKKKFEKNLFYYAPGKQNNIENHGKRLNKFDDVIPPEGQSDKRLLDIQNNQILQKLEMTTPQDDILSLKSDKGTEFQLAAVILKKNRHFTAVVRNLTNTNNDWWFFDGINSIVFKLDKFSNDTTSLGTPNIISQTAIINDDEQTPIFWVYVRKQPRLQAVISPSILPKNDLNIVPILEAFELKKTGTPTNEFDNYTAGIWVTQDIINNLKDTKLQLSDSMTDKMRLAFANAIFKGKDGKTDVRKLMCMAQVEFEPSKDVVETKTETRIEDDIKPILNSLNTTSEKRFDFFKSKQYIQVNGLNLDRLKSKKSTLSKNMTNVMKNAYAKALYYADESNTIDDGIDNINRIRKLLAMAQVEFEPKI